MADRGLLDLLRRLELDQIHGGNNVAGQDSLNHLRFGRTDQTRVLFPDHPATLGTRTHLASWLADP